MSICRIARLFLAMAVSVLTPGSATAGWDVANAAYERGDYQTAFHELVPLAIAGDPLAQVNIGLMYASGQGVPENYAEALRWYRMAAAQGNAIAQFNMGAMYYHGEGVPQDFAEAARWCRMAADRGNANAQTKLGAMYVLGQGVPQNDAEGVRWYRLAADQGFAEAQFNLGVMYSVGRGVPQNDAEAVRWLRMAADQGDANAQYYLGVIHASGQGVPQNDAEAVRWYRRAAEQGASEAQTSLGAAYTLGKGVPRDHAEAVRWFRRAADQGDAGGQFLLGMSYALGKGVRQDYVQAYVWLDLAAARLPQGEDRSQNVEWRDRVAAHLSPTQRTRAEEMARNWRPTVAARSEGGASRMATLEGASHDLSHAERSPWGSPVKDSPPTDGRVPPQQPPEREVIGPAFLETPPPHPGQLTASGQLSQKAVSRAVERALMFGPVFEPGREQIAPAFSDLPQAFPERQPGFGATAGFVAGLLTSPPVQAGAWFVETIRELQMDREPGYDPFLDPQIDGFEDHMGFLMGARSKEQMAHRIGRLRKRLRLEEVVADSPTAAFAGSITIVAAVLGVALGAWAECVKRHRGRGSR